jgi:hypothetical protein
MGLGASLKATRGIENQFPNWPARSNPQYRVRYPGSGYKLAYLKCLKLDITCKILL